MTETRLTNLANFASNMKDILSKSLFVSIDEESAENQMKLFHIWESQRVFCPDKLFS